MDNKIEETDDPKSAEDTFEIIGSESYHIKFGSNGYLRSSNNKITVALSTSTSLTARRLISVVISDSLINNLTSTCR